MATIANAGGLIPERTMNGVAAGAMTRVPEATKRRRIAPEAGRALEMLGHAIEYLADEFALECRNRGESVARGKHPQVTAIELLMTSNREVYFNCPTVATLGDRLRSWLHLQRA
jgi:hypothetical protein